MGGRSEAPRTLGKFGTVRHLREEGHTEVPNVQCPGKDPPFWLRGVGKRHQKVTKAISENLERK